MNNLELNHDDVLKLFLATNNVDIENYSIEDIKYHDGIIDVKLLQKKSIRQITNKITILKSGEIISDIK